ncbi:hypothetical protein Maqu_1207 [Marinobacter nauticus VT8]|uniref:Uncharacterized protein n=2 Tax=Marinobacter nauticus TaxID=2743 RepID=A1TZX8_MARN8|nr:hypothetical protein Maqu_1207 [Marinobacter nauticus VT8]
MARQYQRVNPSLGTTPYTQKCAVARKAGGVCMKSIILMFVGGFLGGLIGPVTALVGVAAGYMIGRALTHSVAPKPSEESSACR